jgi:hypothetical protein
MSGRNQKARDAAADNYPPYVLLEPCPKCGAKATRWCKRPNGSGIVNQVPHEERVRLAYIGR